VYLLAFYMVQKRVISDLIGLDGGWQWFMWS